MGTLEPATTHADLAACRAMLAGGSKSFRAAARLLPARVAEQATALYAFCRVADDVIDLEGGPDAMRRLHARLDGIYAGRPHPHPADRAFSRLVLRRALPRALPEALLEGFAWDEQGRVYEDLPALEAYAARVAAAVGALMTLLMGARSPEAIARACDLGVAMQYTNICRDVGEDARNGRLYLPRDWMRQEGLHPDAFLANPVHSPALGRVIARLLREADALYRRSEAGVPLLPADCRPGIAAARLIYAEIGRQVERQGLDSVSRRAVVPGRRKAQLLGQALQAVAWRAGRPGTGAPPLPGTRFLVEAVAATTPPLETPRNMGERIVWAAELFARMDRPAAMRSVRLT